MTVGFVLDDTLDVSDGVQQAVLTTGAEMTRRGYDVHYIVAETSTHSELNVHSISKFAKFKFNGNSVRTPLPAPKEVIKSLFKDIAFDMLCVQMPYSPLLSGRVISLAPKNVKIFGTFHILPYSKKTYFATQMLGKSLKRTLKLFDRVYAVSEPALHFMKSTFGIDGHVLPNPISYDTYHSEASFKKTSPKNKVVFVGRFDERKGVMQLIKAVNLLDKKVLETTEFIMCGKGPLHEKAVVLATAYNLPISFPGYVSLEEKIEYLSSATIAIFPSISGESFGIVLAEAMAAGAEITLGGNNPGYASVLKSWDDVLFDGSRPDKIA